MVVGNCDKISRDWVFLRKSFDGVPIGHYQISQHGRDISLTIDRYNYFLPKTVLCFCSPIKIFTASKIVSEKLMHEQRLSRDFATIGREVLLEFDEARSDFGFSAR